MTITLTFTGDTPTSVSLTSLVRLDTGEEVAGLTLPDAFTDAGGGVWTYEFAEPLTDLTYCYQGTVTWSDASTTPVVGTVGLVQIVNVDAIADAVSNALAGASNITVLGTVNGQVIEVVRKDTYVGYGRDFTFTKVAGEPWPDDLSGWAVTWTANRSPNNQATGTATGVASVTLTGTVTTPTGTQVVTMSPGTTQTNALAIGLGARGYLWDVTATKGTNRATLRQGTMNVRENQTA